MELSNRLSSLVKGIAPGSVVADIGCGHGQASMWLAQQGYRVIACDISAPTLKLAQKLAEESGCADKIDFRLCSGLAKLAPGEADAIIIAGMGGHTMTDILSAHPGTAAHRSTFLALQPQNSPEHVRTYLWDNGYGIFADEAVLCGGRFYNCIKAASAREYPRPEGEYAALLGDISLRARSKDYPAFIKHELNRLGSILKNVDAKRSPGAALELSRLMEKYKEVAHELYGW